MSFRNRAAAATCILALSLFQLPAFSQQLTKEEEVAAQNFNGVDITDSSLAGQQNGIPSGSGIQNGAMNQNALVKSMMQNGLQSNLSNQNTQLGQATMFNNGNMNGGANTNINPGMVNQINNGMNSGINTGMGANNMSGCNNAMGGNFNGTMQGDCNTGMNAGMGNGMMNGGGIVQSIGNSIMSDPKMMQRAVGVAGAAALLGVFMGNGGIGGMMRSAGIDNTRHIRGSVVGY